MSSTISNDPQIRPYCEKLDKIIKEIKDLQEEIEKIKQEKISTLNETEISSLESEIILVSKKKFELEQFLKNKYESSNKKELKIKDLQEKVKNIEIKLLENNNFHEELCNEIRDLENDSTTRHDKINHLIKKYNSMISEKTKKIQFVDEKIKINEKIESLQHEYDVNEAELINFTNDIENNKSLFVEIEDSEVLDENVELLLSEISSLNAKILLTQSKISNYKEILSLKQELEYNENECECKKSDIAELQKEKIFLTAEIEGFQNKNSVLQEKISELPDQSLNINALETKKQDLLSEIVSLSDQIKVNENTFEDLQKSHLEYLKIHEKHLKRNLKLKEKEAFLEKLKNDTHSVKNEKKTLKDQLKSFKIKINDHKSQNLKDSVPDIPSSES